MARVFGEIDGYPEGSEFVDRRSLHECGVHRPLQHGISGSAAEGADSIVVSGGYEDDEDFGDVIIYTGAGGNDPATSRQIADQELSNQNLALAVSATEGLPVRLVRGSRGDSRYSPTTGYRYDGLYRVEDFWEDLGSSAHKIVRYRLVKLTPDVVVETTGGSDPTTGAAPRITSQTQRIIRNTAVTQRVKELYGHRCQVCREVLQTPAGPYAEGAHIRPLGRPHDGPDVEANVLCLCPTDHVRLDYGGIVIRDDLVIVDVVSGNELGTLLVAEGHPPPTQFLTYHRGMRTFS
jgi:putative restriction endonuclease